MYTEVGVIMVQRQVESEDLKNLILYAIMNFDKDFSQRTMSFLKNMGINGYIIVSKFNNKDLPFCGLACSLGLGGFGIIFIEERILYNHNIPKEFKDFILAHELAHIVRGHIVSKIFIRFLSETFIQALSESIRSIEKAGDILDKLISLIFSVFLFKITFKLVTEIDPQQVKQEELEADEIAIKLTGCKGALMFAKMLEQLKMRGYNVSHESMLGFPALTVDERIRFIKEKCI